MGESLLNLDSFPPSWEVSSIGSEVEFTRKPRGLELGKQATVPFIPMDLLPDDRLFTETFEPRPSAEISSGVFFNEGDILLAKITPCLENGKQAIPRNIPGGWGYATTEVFPLRPKRLSTEFLAFYLRTGEVRRLLATKMQGV
jgi:type I restriction enzyme S subunit